MKRFYLKCGVFLLPLALVFLPIIYHLERFRELESIEVMAGGGRNAELISLAYSDPMHLVKQEVLKNRQPSIIALGTSRVLQIQKFIFDEPADFYNCGRSVRRVQDLKSFLSSYPGKKPTMIILGLDQDFFGVGDEDMEREPRSYTSYETTYSSRAVKASKSFFSLLQEGQLELGEGSGDASRIGLNARLYSDGYRRDGSYLYGKRLLGKKSDGDYKFAKTIKRIDKRKGRFASAERVHPKAIEEVDGFLELCKEHQIHVVGFFPPYPNKVYRRFAEERAEFPHVFEIQGLLEPVFVKHGFLLFDFSDIALLGSNDFETFDGYHASETAYLKIMDKMVAAEPLLENVMDMNIMRSLLSNPYSARQLRAELEEAHPKLPAIINQQPK